MLEAMARERKTSPLWQYVPARAYVPPTGPRPTDVGFTRPQREVGEQDLRPLRVDDDWGVARILEILPPAKDGSEHLAWLLVAAAVTQGPGRVLELAEKTYALLNKALPRLEMMTTQANIARHAPLLKQLASGARLGIEELTEVRSRGVNDADPFVSKPFGLRLLDLSVTALHVRTAVGVEEVSRRAHPAGVAWGRAILENPPTEEIGNTWVRRLLGSSPLRGVQLFFPQEYGRLVLVFSDGRLAYDPGELPPPPPRW